MAPTDPRLLTTLEPAARTRALLIVAVVVWVATFVVVRAYAIAHGDMPIRWDVGWYVDIALRGYRFDGDIAHQQPVAFLPAWPYVLRTVLLLGMPLPLTLLLTCIVCAIGGTALLFRALTARLPAATSARACALLVASPFSLYFLNGYSESLYFLVMAAFWWALLARRDDGLATLFAGLSGLIRPFGLLLAVIWAFDLIAREHRAGTPWHRIAARLAMLGPLAIAGPLLVAVFYGYRFGDIFLYENIRLAWNMDVLRNGAGDLIGRFGVQLRTLAQWHPLSSLTDAPQFGRLLLWAFVVTLPFAWRRVPRPLLAYGVGLVLFALLLGEGGADLGRHLATNVALPICLASMLAPSEDRGERVWHRGALLVLFIAGLVMQAYFSSQFFHGRWIS